MGLRAANLETDVEKLWVEGKTHSVLITSNVCSCDCGVCVCFDAS